MRMENILFYLFHSIGSEPLINMVSSILDATFSIYCQNSKWESTKRWQRKLPGCQMWYALFLTSERPHSIFPLFLPVPFQVPSKQTSSFWKSAPVSVAPEHTQLPSQEPAHTWPMTEARQPQETLCCHGCHPTYLSSMQWPPVTLTPSRLGRWRWKSP